MYLKDIWGGESYVDSWTSMQKAIQQKEELVLLKEMGKKPSMTE